MDEETLREFLKNNLTIRLKRKNDYEGKVLEIGLYLEDTLISTDFVCEE